MRSSQLGRALENLAENAWTAGSDGRLVTYLPVLDSHAVDRAVAAGSGAPLFVQVKGHQRARPGDRLAFAIPAAEVGAYDRWLALLLHGGPERIDEAYLVPGADLQRLGERGRTAGGRPCLHVTLSPTSPTFGRYALDPAQLGPALEALATEGQPEPLAAMPPERSQEEGAYFEESVVAAVYAGSDRLALYRPAVDVGRDLLVQLAGTPRSLYLQVKGTEREDRPGLARFQVRRRSLLPDPALAFVFAYRAPGRPLGPLWLVTAADLLEKAASGDPDHLSFEAHIEGPDPRWAASRTSPDALPERLLEALAVQGRTSTRAIVPSPAATRSHESPPSPDT